MGNYRTQDARFTAIFVRMPQKGGERELYVRVPFELVRFNVDVNPDATTNIIPVGQNVVNQTGDKPDSPKLYEKIWIVDSYPWRDKHWFGGVTS